MQHLLIEHHSDYISNRWKRSIFDLEEVDIYHKADEVRATFWQEVVKDKDLIKFISNDLKKKGAIFIEDLNEVPAGATLIFSAHGVPQSVQEEAERRGFRIFDATCPLVSKVHVEVAKLAREGYEFIKWVKKGTTEEVTAQ